MKLYTLDASRYGSRVLIQIAAKGLTVEVETLPFPLPASFAKINPLMLVPVLDTGEGLLPESQVICEYLEDRFPEPSLRPEAPRERARMRLLIRLFELYYDPAHMKLFPLLLAPGSATEAAKQEALAGLRKAVALLGAHLSGAGYAVGGTLSLADCALAPPLLQTQVLSGLLGLPDPLAAHPAVAGYFEAVRRDRFVAPVTEAMIGHLRRALPD